MRAYKEAFNSGGGEGYRARTALRRVEVDQAGAMAGFGIRRVQIKQAEQLMQPLNDLKILNKHISSIIKM